MHRESRKLGWLLGLILPLECLEAADGGVHAASTIHAPVIDGHLDSGEWAAAEAVRAFIQVEPQINGTPSEQTTLWLLRDDEFLYVALALTQSSRLVAREWVQDADLSGDDFVSVQLDPFASREKGYAFSVNPNGARSESLISDGDDYDEDWEDLW
ncbi:MAG: hypothetical protein KDI71_15660, partial [Xanthomonadales bacterium]|nr:hypothetical protein [Xanthomonadales bacterium]